jgi:4-hydroxy-2-oxoheptanedioate aldolase
MSGPANVPDLRLGAWSDLGAAGNAAVLARAGFDWLVLDGQHGSYDDLTLRLTLNELRPAPCPVWVRVLENRPGVIGRALDAGATGIIVPMVDTADQAAAAVNSTYYPPRGQRSWGQMPAMRGAPVVPAEVANEAVGCAVMVETAAGLADVAAIAATPGLSMIFVGPFDLSLALGTTVEALLDDDTPSGPLPRVVAACAQHGITPGVFAGTVARGQRLATLGFSSIVVATDSGLLGDAARSARDSWGH